MNKKISIAIDGPASAGKSTVSKQLAKKLGYIYVDTGAMYRTITYAVLANNIDPSNEEKIVELLETIDISFETTLSGQNVLMNGVDVSSEIREDLVTNTVSQVSAHKIVREKLVARQQKIGKDGGVVMDGRDIGTAVLPHAELKIFLIASVDERAQRRFDENIAKGMQVNFEKLKQEIIDRDYKDTHRKNSPLIQAKDAISIDTTGMDIQAVVQEIEKKLDII